MNGRFQMQGDKKLDFAERDEWKPFFWDYRWMEIWSNHLLPSMGPNEGIVAMDSGLENLWLADHELEKIEKQRWYVSGGTLLCDNSVFEIGPSIEIVAFL